ncbi:MAG: hypothetical protein VX498_06800 [Myxococcota bacterium]|nr:hypothetical protein [Myxococcota bacterium]
MSMRNMLLCFFLFWVACAGPAAQQPDAEPTAEAGGAAATEAEVPPSTDTPTAREEGPGATSTDAAVAATRTRCCDQCGSAASQDPAGRDISQKPCLEYIGYVVNGAAPIDEACSKWFDANPTLTVSACD